MFSWVWGGTTTQRAVKFTRDQLYDMMVALRGCGKDAECRRMVREMDLTGQDSIMFYRF